MANMKKKVLVTGGAGFIGCHVARHLIQSGYPTVVFDDLSGGFQENVPVGAEFVKGDVGNPELVDDVFHRHSFQHIFHLAAYAAEGLSHFIRVFNYNNNLISSMNLINASVRHNVETFIFTSSIAVYGKSQLPMSECMNPIPEDPYGISKYAVELDLRAAHEMFGLDYIIFRPHNVYGPNQNLGDPYRNVIGIFMNQLMKGEPLTIFGEGNQTRAFSYIDDVAPIIARSIEVPEARGKTFNVGADQPVSVNELAHEVITAMGVKGRLKQLAPRNEVVHAFASHDMVRETFSPLPSPVLLPEGLKKMAEWAKQAGSRSGKVFEEVELTKNLPPSWQAMLKQTS